MKILHTADWHLGDRLGRIDRTDDLRRAVERVAGYCAQEKVDVLLVAGDLFSELARPDSLRETIRHWQDVFADFLHRGGTILTLTGNHDNEGFCRTLTHAMNLAAPLPLEPGEVVPAGRLYLATEPTLLRLADRSGEFAVQFLLMPYPTAARYLRDEASQRYTSVEEKNRQLQTAYREALRTMRQHARFDPALPAVLSAHVHVRGANVSASLFRLSEEDDVIFEGEDLPPEFAYVALGHIHKPQFLGGQAHVRYSGSIERMDLGEKDDGKSVVLVEVGRDGRAGEPVLLPLPATPIYEVSVRNPREEIPRLREEYAEAKEDLVNLHLTYTAGVDNLEETLRQLEEIFPRWYSRDWTEASTLGPSLAGSDARPKSFAETVRDYLEQELLNHPEEERAALLERAEELMKEME
ncbi:MAG TPA: exonuclease SbcCD subunit D [Gemmataceae bacterium]